MQAGRFEIIEQEMQKHGLDYKLVLTERPWHAADLAEQGAREGYEVVVVASGDGTANEALNGLMRAKDGRFRQDRHGADCGRHGK